MNHLNFSNDDEKVLNDLKALFSDNVIEAVISFLVKKGIENLKREINNIPEQKRELLNYVVNYKSSKKY